MSIPNDVWILIYERATYRATLALASTCHRLYRVCETAWSYKLKYRGLLGSDRSTYKEWSECGTPKVFSFQLKRYVHVHKELRRKYIRRVDATTFADDVWIVAVHLCYSDRRVDIP
jgi:hypothetical protein